jgi:hypothetical protein
MIIVIEGSSARQSAVDTALQRAFSALHVSKIGVLGGGRFTDGTGYVVLVNDGDTAAALAALTRLDIGASVLHPSPSPKPVV